MAPRAAAVGALLLASLLSACSPPPAAAPAPTTPPAAAAKPTEATKPAEAAKPAATTAPAGGAASPQSCKIGQIYTSPTSDKGWSWAHEQGFLNTKKDLPYVDLSIRKDSVPDDNKQAVTDLIESMVQQGAKAIYTTSFGFMEPTRQIAAKYPEVAFFHASGFPGPNDPPNIGYYFGTIEEGRYITGQVAGLVVEPGANIGYVAAHPIPEVFRGVNAFALGVSKTNPTAKVHNKWTLTWFDPKLERDAAAALLEAPVRAQLITNHADSTGSMLAAQEAGKFGIAYHAPQNDAAPKTILTSAIWNWVPYVKPTIEGVCTGQWAQGGKVTIPQQYKNYMGTMKDGLVDVAPLNMDALASHPRKDAIKKTYDDEVAAFKAGRKSFETVFTGPIKDNTGTMRVESKPDIGKLYDENGMWFAENVVGSVKP